MTDKLSSARKAWNMSRIRASDTQPELRVRRLVHAAGYRFRLHVKDLPGVPDLVFPRYRLAIFVHGCFWHGHNCIDGHLPKSNERYWKGKLRRNTQRDMAAQAKLEQLGWRTTVIWECEADNGARRLVSLLSKLRAGECADLASRTSRERPPRR